MILEEVKGFIKGVKKLKVKEYEEEEIKKLEREVKEIFEELNIRLGNLKINNLKNIQLTALENEVKRYKAEEKNFEYLKKYNYESLDLDKLPEIQQKLGYYIRLLPETRYPNSAIVMSSLYALAHYFGQLRPRIDDIYYSKDRLGINFYGFIISDSGSGKDRTKHTISKLFENVKKYVDKKKREEQVKKARDKVYKMKKKEDPEFNGKITEEEIQEYIKPYLDTEEDCEFDPSSTVEGVTKVINTLEKTEYSTVSMFMSEMGLSIINKLKEVSNIFEKFAVLYDMGQAKKKLLKSEELHENGIKGTYPNMLGISSPAFIFTNKQVRNFLKTQILGAYARRAVVIYTNVRETYENFEEALESEEAYKLTKKKLELLTYLEEEIKENLRKAIENLDNERVIKFDEKAGKLYDSFKKYTKALAEMVKAIEPTSPLVIALEGRAFLTGRIAGLWTIAEGDREITEGILKAAIYFIMYSNNHLIKLINQLNNKPYEMFVNDYRLGLIGKEVALHKAIELGYLDGEKKSINGFIEIVNSVMKGEAVVKYDKSKTAFIIEELVKVEGSINGVNEKGSHYYKIGQGKIPDIVKTEVLTSKALLLPITKCVYTPFISTKANLVVITLIKPKIDIDTMHNWLINVAHTIVEIEEEKYQILIPTSTEIKSKSEYAYIVQQLATYLLSNTEKDWKEGVYYGYEDKKHYINTTIQLLDISEYQKRFAEEQDIEVLPKENEKITESNKQKRREELIKKRDEIISKMLNEQNPIFVLARYIWEFKVIKVERSYIEDVIDNVIIYLNNKIIITEEDIKKIIKM